MRKIKKTDPPTRFRAWLAMENDDWTPRYQDMPGDIKNDLFLSICDEQEWLCCYCEGEIDSNSSHVEHFIPQSHRTDLELIYKNLLASCIRNPDAGAPLHCGVLKKDVVLSVLSPVDEDLSARLNFSADGRVRPRLEEDVAMTEAIVSVGLDIPKLRRLREAAINALIDFSDGEVSDYLKEPVAYVSALKSIFGS